MRFGRADRVMAPGSSSSMIVSVNGREPSSSCEGSVPLLLPVQWPSTTSDSSPSTSESSTTVMSLASADQPFDGLSFFWLANVTSPGDSATPPVPSLSRHPV